MPQLTILPHGELCPGGIVIEAEPGESLCESLIKNGISIEHACEMSCACATCHVVVREGFHTLTPADDQEEDMLDRAWGLTSHSRLACRIVVDKTPLVIEIPRYSINFVK